MSETIIETPQSGEPVNSADLERMLAESRKRETTLERERDEERGTRRRVEQERDEVATQVKSAAELRYAAELSAADMAINAAKSAADHAKGALRTAMEAGDFGAVADAQEAIATAAMERSQAVAKKGWLDTNKEQLTRAPARTEAAKPTGKYAQYVGELLDSEERWIDDHPEFVRDAKFRQKVMGASQVAGQEHVRGSPEYLQRIEEIIGEAPRQEVSRETPRQPRQQSADLPAGGHRAPGAPAGGLREIRLSADEAEIANSLYGNPSNDMFIAEEADRFKRYAANRERMRGRQT